MKSLTGYLRTRKLRSRLETPPIVIKQQIENIDISFAVHTWVEYHNRATTSYSGEPDMVEFIRKNMRSNDVFWDVGANVGAYSLLAAKINSSGSQVIAFEPYIPTFAHLWDNIVLNNCNEKVIPLCVALADHTNLDFLGVSDPRAGSSEHTIGDPNLKLTQPSFAIKGDEALTIFDLPHPTLLKIDVDGYELQVLKGMVEILGNPLLREVIIEVERGKTEKPVINLMSKSGFRKVSDSSLMTDLQSFNVVFRRKK